MTFTAGSTSAVFDTACVLGGGIVGLLAARVLPTAKSTTSAGQRSDWRLQR